MFFFPAAVYVCAQVVYCDPLPRLLNGLITYRNSINQIISRPFPVGTTAEYECNIGYGISGVTTNRCIEDIVGVGEWVFFDIELTCNG